MARRRHQERVWYADSKQTNGEGLSKGTGALRQRREQDALNVRKYSYVIAEHKTTENREAKKMEYENEIDDLKERVTKLEQRLEGVKAEVRTLFNQMERDSAGLR